MKNRFKIFALLAAVTGIAACSGNSTGPDEPDPGSASLTVSGDSEGQKGGIADFNSLEAGIYTWEILIHDYNPQTFSLTLMLVSNNPIERPGPGTYEIGRGTSDPSVFTATYSDAENGLTNATEFSTLFGNYGGTLTITESSDDQIKGTFEFTASDYDLENDQPNGEIEVSSGEFTAKQRM